MRIGHVEELRVRTAMRGRERTGHRRVHEGNSVVLTPAQKGASGLASYTLG